MKGWSYSSIVLFLCLSALGPVRAGDDDDNNSNIAPKLVGEILFIQPASAPVPFGALPNPNNTVRVLTLAGGVRIIEVKGLPVTNRAQMVVGATVSGTGMRRADGSIVATELTFTAKGTPGAVAGQITAIHSRFVPVPLGFLPNPRNTVFVVVLASGERVILTTTTSADRLRRLALGATLSGTALPRADGTAVATRVRFD
jgi:hypothetical protein